jgi:hypothetical protein
MEDVKKLFDMKEVTLPGSVLGNAQILSGIILSLQR